MKLQKFLLKAFDNQDPKPIISIDRPAGAVLQKAIILPTGINLIYAVPEVQMTVMETDRYVLVKPEQSIPDKADLVDILDGVFETDEEGGQGVILFPIYKLHKK